MFKNTLSLMSIAPRAIQELLEELEDSKQSRQRAWDALQKIRAMHEHNYGGSCHFERTATEKS
jgi:hypothetical protein